MNQIGDNIKTTTFEVIEKIGNPVSVMVVVATLESFGIRNKDVFTDYGFVTIQDLANHIYEDIKGKDIKTLLNATEKKRASKDKLIPVSGYLWMKAKLLIQFYPLGLFHLLPIFFQVVSIILFGYSLWTFVGFNIIQSTVVVFGVILGLILSGGYVQVLGRQASFYWHHGEFPQFRIVVDKLIKSGMYGIVKAFLLLSLINFFFNLYPFSFVLVTFIYAFLIGTLLLVTAPFHTLKQRWVISFAIIVATGLALILKLYTSFHTYFTHWIGIIAAIFISRLFLQYFFKKNNAVYEKENVKPKKLMVIYKNYRYFFYGTLIYVFLFIDRAVAWSANTGNKHQFIFLYEKNYEIGMDIAILIFFMLAGVLEYSIASFSKFLDVKQKTVLFVNVNKFNSSFIKMYWGHVLLLLVTVLATTTVIYLIITQPWGYEASFGEVLDTLSIRVCIIGGFGYFFLTWGMLNTLYLFTLDQPKVALKALFMACIVNLLLGYAFSRIISYEYSVVGMLIGAIIFMVITLKENMKFFRKLDYYYYASY
ncbi:MAG: hypothetical protein V3U92_15570 [Cellulophaga sp.]